MTVTTGGRFTVAEGSAGGLQHHATASLNN